MTDRTAAADGLVEMALELGATRASAADAEGIRVYPEVRGLCKQNSCGAYGTNLMCPPHVGPLSELEAALHKFESGLLIQTIVDLDGPFDVEGMDAGGASHRKTVHALARRMRSELGVANVLPLGAGPCTACKKCAIADDLPCPFPERSISSLEAYGMNVKQVVEKWGLEYSAGANTVSYVALFLYNGA